jgi:hypothetical protein
VYSCRVRYARREIGQRGRPTPGAAAVARPQRRRKRRRERGERTPETAHDGGDERAKKTPASFLNHSS